MRPVYLPSSACIGIRFVYLLSLSNEGGKQQAANGIPFPNTEGGKQTGTSKRILIEKSQSIEDPPILFFFLFQKTPMQ